MKSIAALLCLLIFVPCAAAADSPNIVLIFVDDLGYGDLGCYGNKQIATPHIDRLAAEGQRWTSFYASGSTCVPSRKGLMSGRHPNFIPRPANGLKDDPDALLPAMLKRQGYATAILGKWHLAGYPDDFTNDPMHPLECGFDMHLGTPGSNDVPAPKGKKQTRAVFDKCGPFTFQVPLIRGREVLELPTNQELLTKRYTQEAVRWIDENKEHKFFLYLAHNMPHAPVFASPEFQGRSRGGRFGDVVEEIDWSVGQVMSAIQQAGIDDKTLVIFTSDNGPWSVFGLHAGTAAPLRGEKSTTWEGGLRVPAIFRWPGQIEAGTVDGIAANLDLYATFATLTGGEQPRDKPGYISLDLSDALLNRAPSPRSSWAYHGSAYRSGRYKIHTTIIPPTEPINRGSRPAQQLDKPMLFDLETDIAEEHDLADKHPEIVARLLSEMEDFRRQPQSADNELSSREKTQPRPNAVKDYQVTSPPATLDLAPFYKKYVSAGGYPIVSSEAVNDYALKEAAYLVDMMLANRPDIRQAMIDSGSRMIVMGYREFTTDIPEHAHLRPKDYWDARARGLGGSRDEPVCSCAEENVLAFAGDPYWQENILIHEFAHNIHLRGMVNVDATFDDRLKRAYERSMAQGLWKSKYASTNHAEYFAEGVQSWFNNNRQPDHDHNHVDTRQELQEYDPDLAAMCAEVFGDTELVYTKPTTRLNGHLAGYDPSQAPEFRWPEKLEQVKQRIREQIKQQGENRAQVYEN